MADIVLNDEEREQSGTGAARAVRRAGKVPGILYGGDQGPVGIAVQSNAFRKALYLAPDHPDALSHLVVLAERRGDADQAAALRRRLARLSNRGGTT